MQLALFEQEAPLVARIRVAMCHPGHEVPIIPSGHRCWPTVLYDRELPNRPYFAGCLGCGWLGPQREEENDASEDANDHAWPGWRDLPVVPGPPAHGLSRAAQRAFARWRDDVDSVYPPGWLEDGGPIRTARSGYAGRHVPAKTPWGGFDMAYPDTQQES